METTTRRFREFTNEEVNILLRQAALSDTIQYSQEEKKTCGSLLLEIQEEKRIRLTETKFVKRGDL